MRKAWLVLLLCAVAAVCRAQDADALRAHYRELAAQLASNQFQRPLHVQSQQASDSLTGDIYAVIDQPFGTVEPALQGAVRWCDILILHLNVKYCRASRDGDETLKMVVGRKYDQPIEDAYPIEFDYRLAKSSADYLQVLLTAAEGPLGTKDYRIMVEVVPIDAARSFLHMTYSYGFGTAARVAMAAYLATIGRNKVGFSIVGRREDGQPIYIRGVRGVVERNAMRYYLAIEAYLDALRVPPAQQTEKRLSAWYAAIERYPVQLHELERDEYLTMKRQEIRREQLPARQN